MRVYEPLTFHNSDLNRVRVCYLVTGAALVREPGASEVTHSITLTASNTELKNARAKMVQFLHRAHRVSRALFALN